MTSSGLSRIRNSRGSGIDEEVVLEFDRTSHCRDRTGKFSEHAITGRFDEAPRYRDKWGSSTSRLIRLMLT
jgi:hypothetical protein